MDADVAGLKLLGQADDDGRCCGRNKPLASFPH